MTFFEGYPEVVDEPIINEVHKDFPASEAGLKKAIKKYGPKVLKAGKTGIMGTVKRFPLASRVAVPYALYSAAEPTPVDEKYGITRMENLFPMIGDTKSTMEKKFKRNTPTAKKLFKNLFKFSIFKTRKEFEKIIVKSLKFIV